MENYTMEGSEQKELKVRACEVCEQVRECKLIVVNDDGDDEGMSSDAGAWWICEECLEPSDGPVF